MAQLNIQVTMTGGDPGSGSLNLTVSPDGTSYNTTGSSNGVVNVSSGNKQVNVGVTPPAGSGEIKLTVSQSGNELISETFNNGPQVRLYPIIVN